MTYSNAVVLNAKSLEYRDFISKNFLAHYVMPILTYAPHSTTTLESMGSCVIVKKADRIFLVTALHVVENIIESSNPHIIKLSGKSIAINELAYCTAEENDLAVTELFHNWLFDNEVYLISAYDIEQQYNAVETEEIYVSGYPAAKTKINTTLSKTDICLLTLTTNKATCNKSKTVISTPLILKYDRNKFITSDRNNYGKLPKLNGISGGGIFQLYEDYTYVTNEIKSVGLIPKLIGIALECRLDEEIIVGSTIEDVVKLISETIHKNDLAINEIRSNEQSLREKQLIWSPNKDI